MRTVLDYLAVAEPLRRSDLTAVAGEDAVDQAEAAGAVAADDDAMVYPAHPLYTGRVRAALAPEAARALRTSLVEQLAPRSSGQIGDQLRLSALAVESDTLSAVADIVAAAQHALRLGELVLAEQLAQAALDRSGGLPARLPLAYALAWQGRGREADAVLAAVDPEQLSQSELIAWALPRAANQFWMLSEPERATAFLQTIRGRISAPTAQATLDALAGTFAMNAGTPLLIASTPVNAAQPDENARATRKTIANPSTSPCSDLTVNPAVSACRWSPSTKIWNNPQPIMMYMPIMKA